MAADLIGTWTVDVDATWGRMTVAQPQLAELPLDQSKGIKDTLAGISYEVTKDKMIIVINDRKKEEPYTVTKGDGDSLIAESTDANGMTTKSRVEFLQGGRMMLINLLKTDQQMVYKKVTAKK